MLVNVNVIYTQICSFLYFSEHWFISALWKNQNLCWSCWQDTETDGRKTITLHFSYHKKMSRKMA